MRRNGRSVAESASRATRIITLIMIVPAAAALVLLFAYANTYSRAGKRMADTARLKPMIETTLPERIWSAVSGRESYEACGADGMIEDVNRQLDAMISESGNRLELVVARRAMNTLAGYAAEIRDNMRSGGAVTKSEELLGEVRSVASLIENMLNESITAEAAALESQTRVLSRIVILVFVLGTLLLALALALSEHMRRRMVRDIRTPIDRLRETTVRLAGGDLSARADPADVTELRELTESVNVMANRLQELIRQNKAEQENLKKAEMRTLMAQINPHFLYNTLDTILWQAEADNSGEVIRLTRALSDFFRISLSSGRDWITVEEELRHLTGYLSIQKTRYRDVLNYEIDVDPAMMGGTVLKLLLQPLVENAIYHGIKEHRGGGTITIRGRRDGRFFVFTVRDTGTGMTPDQLQAVRRSLAEGTEMPHRRGCPGYAGSGFGLRNVDQRIRLYYGQEEGLTIGSGPEGTEVSFRVPAETGGEREWR